MVLGLLECITKCWGGWFGWTKERERERKRERCVVCGE